MEAARGPAPKPTQSSSIEVPDSDESQRAKQRAVQRAKQEREEEAKRQRRAEMDDEIPFE
jgi:hypothetical protein